MSSERESRPAAASMPGSLRDPADRLGSVEPDETQNDVPVVYGTATPGGRRGFLKTLSHGVAAGSAAALASCGGGDSSSPSSPTQTSFTLSGTVTRSGDGSTLSGATVEAVDGMNAGKKTTTASNGSYSLTGLLQGGFTARASESSCSPLS